MRDHCAVCADSEELLRECNYCTGVYCPDHALPERHNCPGVSEIEADGEWFLTPETDVPRQGGEEVRARPEPLDHDEIRTFGGGGDTPDLAADGSTVETESGTGTDGEGVLSWLVSALRFWS